MNCRRDTFLLMLINSIAENKWAVNDNFFPEELCDAILHSAIHKKISGQLQPALIGKDQNRQIRSDIRGDLTYWLGENEVDMNLQSAWKFLEQVRMTINQELYLGLKRFESHLAIYPPGKGYHKHFDQAPGSTARQLTFILYLNKNWQQGDGGELVIYDEHNNDQQIAKIEPLFGRSVFFLTEFFPHEVLPCKKERISLTGWFRNDPA